jgi:heme O synthase-like polyprenyltransferase
MKALGTPLVLLIIVLSLLLFGAPIWAWGTTLIVTVLTWVWDIIVLTKARKIVNETMEAEIDEILNRDRARLRTVK